ncbi:MAG: hypothetical protein RR575_13995 [Acinetobacter sp.]
MKDYYGIDAGLVVSIESSKKVKSVILFLLFFAISIVFIYFSILYFVSNGFLNYIALGVVLSCLCVLFCIFYLLLESINTEIVFNEDHLLYRKVFTVKKVLYSEIKGYEILSFRKRSRLLLIDQHHQIVNISSDFESYTRICNMFMAHFEDIDVVNKREQEQNFIQEHTKNISSEQQQKYLKYALRFRKILDVLTVIIFFLAPIFDWSDLLFHGMALVYLYLSYPKHHNFYIIYMQKAKISTEVLSFLIMLVCNYLFLRGIIQHYDLAFLFYSLICMSFLLSALYVVFKKKFAQKMKRQMIMVIALALPVVGIYSASLVCVVNSINDNSILSSQDVQVVNKEKNEGSRRRPTNYYLYMRMPDGGIQGIKVGSSDYYNTNVDGSYKMTLHKGNLGITWSAYELQ